MNNHVRTDRQNIALAFRELRKQGYFARMNFKCCTNCAVFAIPPGRIDNFVFYHGQSAEQLDEHGMLKAAMYLHWNTSEGDASPFIEALQNVGFKVSWDGNPSTCLQVEHSDIWESLQILELAFNRG